jgi:hypothetical protein
MKRNEVVMRCSNPKCRCGLFDMPDGSIWLSQFEPPGDQPTGNGGEAFSVSTLPQKYFWHCAGCSRQFVLWRWTPSGVFLVQRQPGARYGNAREIASSSNPFPFSVHASAQFEKEFLDVG